MTNLMKKTVSLLFIVFFSVSMYAQTNYDDFFSDEFAMAGFDGFVSSIYQPNDGQIFVGGNFKWFNGNKELNGIALLNNEANSIQPLGKEILFRVNDVQEFQGQLFIVGSSYIDDNDIFTYNKEVGNWTAVGNVNGSVLDIEQINNDLFISGSFNGGLAKYNQESTEWEAFSDTLFGSNPFVTSIIEYKGQLVIGGYIREINVGDEQFDAGVAMFDTVSQRFQPLGSNLGTSHIESFFVFEDELFAGGSLAKVDSQGSNIDQYMLAKWSEEQNEWEFYEEMKVDSDKQNNRVNSFTNYKGELVAGGSFNTINGNEGYSLAKYNSESDSWHSFDVAFNDQPVVLTLNGNGDELLIGGYITQDEPKIRNLAVWDGNVLSAKGEINNALNMGIKEVAFEMDVYEDKLVFAGFGSPEFNAYHIVQLDLDNKELKSLGLRHPGFHSYSIEAVNGTLYAGGYEKDPYDYIAYLDEDGEWKTLGGGLNGPLTQLDSFNNQLVLMGAFSDTANAYGNRFKNVGIFDEETRSFQDFGDNEGKHISGVYEVDGKIYGFGALFTNEAQQTSAVGKWNAETRLWEAVGNGLSGTVNAMVMYNGKLVAGGWNLLTLNEHISGNSAVMFDEESGLWELLSDAELNAEIFTLAVYNNMLIAGGPFEFEESGKTNLAYFDIETESWKPLGSEIDDGVFDLRVFEDKLYIAGSFKTAGGKAASRITSWTHPELVSNELEERPQEFKLDQNYPNPFNPSTVIRYQLPVNSTVSLKVFDLLGREVATLVNDQLSSGQHEVSFNATHLASGLYIYQLQAGEHTQTSKMLLVK